MVEPTVFLSLAGGERRVLQPAAAGQRLNLGTLVTIKAAQVVLVVENAGSTFARLDGHPRHLGKTSPGLISLDLSRSTGLHRLELHGLEYWFGTEDAKLRTEGVVKMLAELGSFGTGWSGQMVFSDGAGLRDPHVLYAWLSRSADAVLDTCADIFADPRGRQAISEELSRRGGAGVDVPATLALLRSAPRRFLEASDSGPVAVASQSYVPLRVVHKRRRVTFDTSANRRALWMIVRVRELIQEVVEQIDESDSNVRCLSWIARIDGLLDTQLATQLLRYLPLEPAAEPESIELTDSRYIASYALFLDLGSSFGWNPSRLVSSLFSAVQYADQIYQAYVATVIASSLGLTQTATVLGTNQPAFSGEEFDIYLDAHPPGSILSSWRKDTAVPDASRPDVLVHQRSSGQVAVLDAKYRASGGMATEDSRKEVISYMGLYGLPSIGIAYPGAHQTTRVLAAHGRTIAEIPVAPASVNLDLVRSSVLGLLLSPELTGL